MGNFFISRKITYILANNLLAQKISLSNTPCVAFNMMEPVSILLPHAILQGLPSINQGDGPQAFWKSGRDSGKKEIKLSPIKAKLIHWANVRR